MTTSIWPLKQDKLENWAYFDDLLTNKECETIIRIGELKKPEKAKLISEKALNLNVRDSYTSWLIPEPDLFPIYQKLTDAVNEINNSYFNFDLFGFGEAMQFTKYIAPTGKYEKHIDRGLNGYVRKLSIVAQLTDPEEYEGGELVLHTHGEPTVLEKKRGKVYFFPSYVLHEVTPVTKGERCSLVAWLTGPQFK